VDIVDDRLLARRCFGSFAELDVRFPRGYRSAAVKIWRSKHHRGINLDRFALIDYSVIVWICGSSRGGLGAWA
jgi:hypothetical protein